MIKQQATSFVTVAVAALLVVSNFIAWEVEARHKHFKRARHSSTDKGGLSVHFYEESCPMVYNIVREEMQYVVNKDPGQAAGILRIMFHDCFVQGCDASILLERPFTELTASPNNASIRTSSLHLLDNIKETVEVVCPGVVSCADTIVLATAFAIHMVGGPMIYMPTGRRDSIEAANNQTVIDNLPPPTFDITNLKASFQRQGLDVKDLVALSGGHSIGKAHCRAVNRQLTPTISQDLDPKYANKLWKVCLPTSEADRQSNTVKLDILTQTQFDNAYFRNVLEKRAPFHSDAALLDDPDSAQLVNEYARDQQKFFEQFTLSMTKMSKLGVLTGSQGVIRKKCSFLK
ncbi:hypothetical protein L7F22_052305 [Adiantum nelumboides]|nr:hypothetical protein [Adiantum nelumboides]